MKKLLCLMALCGSVSAMELPNNTLACVTIFDLDKAYNDIVNGNSLTFDSLVDNGRCGYMKPIKVEAERTGAVIKVRYKVDGKIYASYVSAADVVHRRNAENAK